MLSEGYLKYADTKIRRLVVLFTITLSIGFFTGIGFVHHTTSGIPSGINENYIGNENNEEAETMKFKKSEHEMYNLLHTHFLSLSVIFFILALLVYGCNMPALLKNILLIEPMISVIFTFGGIFMVWKSYSYWSYIVMLSGILMTISYILSILFVVKEVLFRSK